MSYTHIDCFSGVGGICTGLHAAGFDTRVAIEYIKSCVDTRDREPSIKAMASFFWSIAIVLDGDFLKLPKFITMVNGGSAEHVTNGWHGMYVFSDKYSQGRIYSTDLDFKNLKEHAINAAAYWLAQRQWFNNVWNNG
ncbi:MAG: hypothetical protein LBR70_06975 [Lactobacillaceae bacterium]|jgi:hypothetical protein|nr:hypothetical protein [Lactobacillaceae bacterium]